MIAIEDIARGVGLSSDDVGRILARAPDRYKVYEIPKRSGGTRQISQPSRELKAVQRYLLRTVMSGLLVSDYATAYRLHTSIRDNAALHIESRFILKLDFTAFFHSFHPADLEYVFRANGMALSRSQLAILRQAVFWRPRTSGIMMLAMGAPTSPHLTNAVMFKIDEEIGRYCQSIGVVYSRYADDITFSGAGADKVLGAELVLRKIVLGSLRPKLKFNESKRGLYGPGQKRMVTGLILTPDGKISIGRERKRLISATVHRWVSGYQFSEFEIEHLRGTLAFVNSCEPTFLENLKNKYGKRPIGKLLNRPKQHFWTPAALLDHFE